MNTTGNQRQDDKERDLIELIRAIPLEPVPDGLVGRVMGEIPVRRTSLLAAAWNLFIGYRTVSFRPAYAIVVCTLILASFYLGRTTRQEPAVPAGTGSASTAVAADSLKNPETAYAIGRALLESDSKAQALAYLTRAALLEPDNPEFAYWEGLGYWSVGSAEQERQSYLRGLEVEPQNVPLLTNLGHSYLGERRYTEALEAYRAVLSIQPEDPTAIYNSGIAYRNLHRVSEEIGAWNSYLRVNRMGSKAARAVQRLNDYGDFSYRIYPIGPRLVILNQTVLLDDAAPPERLYDELFPVMSIMSKNKDVMLEIVVFVDADREAARATASRLKKIIAGAGGSDMESRVAISWFDVPETVISPDGKSEHKLPQSVVLFNRLPDEFSKEITI